MNQPSNIGPSLVAEPLTVEAYRPFGDVLSADQGFGARKANGGTADLFERLSVVENCRPGTASENWKIYRCSPFRVRPVQVMELEKHPSSGQLFVPMGNAGRYLVVVARGDASPDLQTLKVFVATNTQAITYKPGIWHLPMTVLDCVSDMLSLVYEDGSDGDCVVAQVPCEIVVSVE
ncbi:MAG: ureidoglycolate lyase [Gemmataceae bacterium]